MYIRDELIWHHVMKDNNYAIVFAGIQLCVEIYVHIAACILLQIKLHLSATLKPIIVSFINQLCTLHLTVTGKEV